MLGQPLLRVLLGYAALSQFVFSLMIFVVIITQRTAGASAFSIGCFLGAGAMGGVIGVLTSSLWLSRLRFDHLILRFTVLVALSLAVMATSVLSLAAVVLFFVQFVAVPLNGRMVAWCCPSCPKTCRAGR